MAKGETGGLNHTGIAPRNCHVWLAPLPVPQEFRDYGVLAHDRRVLIGDATVAVPIHHINQSILTEEGMRPH